MASTDVVDAVWVASYEARLGMPGHPQNDAALIPGETVVKGLPRGEVEASPCWQPVTKKRGKTDEGGDE